MNKRSYITLFLALSIASSQFFCKTATKASQTSFPENALIINHIAQVPNGRQYTLATEEINNITDVYYYSADQSPVASEFLKSGYTLSDEKNKTIEADVVSNNGAIDLMYTPMTKEVKVTYFKEQNGEKQEMGTITDSAYVGEKYTPLLPIHEENKPVRFIENEPQLVTHGENNFSVLYSVDDSPKEKTESRDKPEDDGAGSSGSRYNRGEAAVLVQYGLNKDSKYVYGYPDGTFKPDEYLISRELFELLYSLSGRSGEAEPFENVLAFLRERSIITENDTVSLNDYVTWSEFYGYIDKFNLSILEDDRLNKYLIPIWAADFEQSRLITRAEAVTVINEMLGIDRNTALSNAGYTDVFEDHWAYEDILCASYVN